MASRKLDTDNMLLFLERGIHVPSRTLFLSGEITRESVDSTIRGLVLLNHLNSEDSIRLVLNSDGGEVNQGLALMDCIASIPTTITIDVVGEACSMAAIILQAGDIRRVSVNSRIMIHVGSESYDENHAAIIRRWAKYQAKEDKICTDKLLTRIREKHPKFTRHRLNRLMDFDTILTATEAIEMGLADAILHNIV